MRFSFNTRAALIRDVVDEYLEERRTAKPIAMTLLVWRRDESAIDQRYGAPVVLLHTGTRHGRTHAAQPLSTPSRCPGSSAKNGPEIDRRNRFLYRLGIANRTEERVDIRSTTCSLKMRLLSSSVCQALTSLREHHRLGSADQKCVATLEKVRDNIHKRFGAFRRDDRMTRVIHKYQMRIGHPVPCIFDPSLGG